MTTFTSEDRESAYKGAAIPSLDEIEARLNEVIAQYERLKSEYQQLKADSNRYIQLWLDTKPKQPLTVEQINQIQQRAINHWHGSQELYIEYARAIEAAHGIGSGE